MPRQTNEAVMVRSGAAACRAVAITGLGHTTDGPTTGTTDPVEGTGAAAGGETGQLVARQLGRGRQFRAGASRATRILTTLRPEVAAS